MIRRMTGLLVLVCSLAACVVPPAPGGTYSRRDVQRAWTIEQATVADVVEVAIEGHTTGLGSVGGGAIGWSLGRTMGYGSSSYVAASVVAVAGAVAGEQIEKNARRQRGFEIVVDLDKGGSIAIIQPADQTFAPGEKVRVYTRRDGSARVAKI